MLTGYPGESCQESDKNRRRTGKKKKKGGRKGKHKRRIDRARAVLSLQNKPRDNTSKHFAALWLCVGGRWGDREQEPGKEVW